MSNKCVPCAQLKASSPRSKSKNWEKSRCFVSRNILEWTTKNNGPSYQMVLAQVSRIDQAIRSKWKYMYRTDLPAGITFTSCISNTEATAENLWTADLTRDMSPGPAGPNLRDQRDKLARATAGKKIKRCQERLR